MTETRYTVTNTFSSTIASDLDFSPGEAMISMTTTIPVESLGNDAEVEVETGIIRRISELESTNSNKESVIEVYNKLVRHYLRNDEVSKAAETLEKALVFAQKAYGEKHPAVAPVLIELAFVNYTLSNYEQAKGYLEPALAIQEKAYGKVSEQAAFVVHKLGRIHEMLGSNDKAEAMYLRSVTTYQNTYSEDDSQIIIARNDLARMRRQRK
ncbi:MAG: tetratricopeptide repeat protein [Candidatus Melainabacteria bacterium]|nr:tetratricopeptide repeat protein [Candidatus Melainabacteria bacterium]